MAALGWRERGRGIEGEIAREAGTENVATDLHNLRSSKNIFIAIT